MRRRLPPGMKIFYAIAAFACLILGTPQDVAAREIVADISDKFIRVTTGFSGADLLLFGATETEGDIVIVIRGPAVPTIVRRKERIAGVWINKDEQQFFGVPTYYALAANRPLAEIAERAVLREHGVGYGALPILPPNGNVVEDARAFREALIRNKQRAELYPEQVTEIRVLDNQLFRSDIHFPSNVPTGNYSVNVLLFKGGELVGKQEKPLYVAKIGLGAEIFEFAHSWPALYGIVAIIVALFAGWFAGAVFKRL